MLTDPLQLQVFRALCVWVRYKHYPPTLRELGAEVYRSFVTIGWVLDVLEARGLVLLIHDANGRRLPRGIGVTAEGWDYFDSLTGA